MKNTFTMQYADFEIGAKIDGDVLFFFFSFSSICVLYNVCSVYFICAVL